MRKESEIVADDGSPRELTTFILTNFRGKTLGEFQVTPDGQIIADRTIARSISTVVRSQGWPAADIASRLGEGWSNGYLFIGPSPASYEK